MDMIDQDLQQIKFEISQLNNKFEQLSILVGNQQAFLNTIVQSINGQISLLNQLVPSLQNVNNKTSDIEIRTTNIDDSIRESIDAINGVIHELNEMKQDIERLKFDAQYSINHTNY